MSDAWEEIQAVKSKRNSLREKLEKRKKERQNILGTSLASGEKPEGSPGGKERPVSAANSNSAPKNEGKFYCNLKSYIHIFVLCIFSRAYCRYHKVKCISVLSNLHR